MQSGWGKIKNASRYAGISERTMRDWLKQGLKHSRLPTGTVLIRFKSIDEFLEKFETGQNQVDRLVDQTLRGL